jgi:xanthine/uracil permease
MMVLGNLIGGFIVVVIGVNLLPTVADQVGAAQQNGNISGTASDTIVGLTTLFFALGIMTAGVSLAVNGLRSAGLA